MSFMDGKHAFLVLIQCTFIKFDMQAMQYTCNHIKYHVKKINNKQISMHTYPSFLQRNLSS